MNSLPEPQLANLLGYAAGSLVFGIFLILLFKDRAGRALPQSGLTVVAASLAFVWNAGSLVLLAADSPLLLVVTTSAVSFLPALLLDLLLEGRLRALARLGYLLSAAAVALHATEHLLPYGDVHLRTLQATAAGFALLTAASLPALQRRRAVAAMALFLFALSFTHLHNEGAAHAWAVELAVHHAGVPLALFVLLHDYRFLLLDAFLRFLANILLAAAFTWAAAEAAHRLGYVDYSRFTSTQAALMALATCTALIVFSFARTAAQHLLTRTVFRRGDAQAILDAFRRRAIESEQSFLDWAALETARFFDAEPGLAFRPGRRAGGRAYLSEDLALLAQLEAVASERLDAHRESELRSLVAQAELRALQAQIHPHFLFNALNALYGMIPKQAAAARATVLNLADIFRYFLQSGRNTIPLEQEITIVRAYLEIESLRLGAKLHTEIFVEPAAARVSIPVLSIQPLVENAVRHGVAPMEEGGTVRVLATIAGERLRVRVSDSGQGFGQVSEPGNGVGLENVRRRLRLCHGESATLNLERAGGETVAVFFVPVQP